MVSMEGWWGWARTSAADDGSSSSSSSKQAAAGWGDGEEEQLAKQKSRRVDLRMKGHVTGHI